MVRRAGVLGPNVRQDGQRRRRLTTFALLRRGITTTAATVKFRYPVRPEGRHPCVFRWLLSRALSIGTAFTETVPDITRIVIDSSLATRPTCSVRSARNHKRRRDWLEAFARYRVRIAFLLPRRGDKPTLPCDAATPYFARLCRLTAIPALDTHTSSVRAFRLRLEARLSAAQLNAAQLKLPRRASLAGPIRVRVNMRRER